MKKEAMPRICLVGFAYVFGAIVSQGLEPVAPRVAISSEPSSQAVIAVVDPEPVMVSAVTAVTHVKPTLASRVVSDHSRTALDTSDMGPVLPSFEPEVPAKFSPIAGAVASHIDVEAAKVASLDTPLSEIAGAGQATSGDAHSEPVSDTIEIETDRNAPKAKIASTSSERQVPHEAAQAASSSESSQPTADEASKPLTPELAVLRKRVQAALDIYRNRTLNTRDNGAWSIMHSFIAYGVDKQLRVGGPTGRPVNAIGWICFNYPCRGERMFYMAGQHIQGMRGPGFQGHDGQFLAMLAQSRVRIDYPMKVGKRDFTVADLVEQEKRTCKTGEELTFKLIGLSHYLDTDETWQSDRGERWDIARLIQEELGQPIVGAACGGTHRLFGLSYAVHRRQRAGKPVKGQYRRAQLYLKDYQDYTFKLQNPDGSFSTEFFASRGAQYDPARRLLTTGHVAEWLAFSLPPDELRRPEMVRAMKFLTKLLIDGRRRELKVGPQGHALHALAIYNERAWNADTKVRGSDALTSAN